jgi:hypothetical protein
MCQFLCSIKENCNRPPNNNANYIDQISWKFVVSWVQQRREDWYRFTDVKAHMKQYKSLPLIWRNIISHLELFISPLREFKCDRTPSPLNSLQQRCRTLPFRSSPSIPTRRRGNWCRTTEVIFALLHSDAQWFYSHHVQGAVCLQLAEVWDVLQAGVDDSPACKKKKVYIYIYIYIYIHGGSNMTGTICV